MPDIIGIAPSNLLVDEVNPRLLEPNEGQREAMRTLARSMPRKVTGDLSAHNRHYLANKADLDKVQAGVRLVVQELLSISGLK